MLLALIMLTLGVLPLYPGMLNGGGWAAFCFVGAMFLFLGSQLALSDKRPATCIEAFKVPLILFGAVLVWIVLQALPFTPDAWHHPLWRLAAEATGEPYEGRISVDPWATYRGGLALLSYGLVIVAVSLAAKFETVVRRMIVILTSIIIGYSLLGLTVWLLGVDSFLWLNDSFSESHIAGRQQVALPFENPGHLATFANVGLILILGQILEQIGSFMIGMSSMSRKLRRAFKHLIADKPHLIIGLVVLVAVLASMQSPAGTVALVAGLCVLIVGAMRANIELRRSRVLEAAMWGGLVLMFGVVAYVSLGNPSVGGAFASTETNTIISSIQASPWLGYGYGSYEAVSQTYAENDATYLLEQVHSAVLESTVGLGIPGVLVLLAALAMLVRIIWRGTRTGPGDRLPAVMASAVGVQMFFHATVENAIQTPTIAFCFAVVVGLGLSQSIPTEKRSKAV